MRRPLLIWCTAAAVTAWISLPAAAAEDPPVTNAVTVVYTHESGDAAADLVPRPGFGVLVRRGAETVLLDAGGEAGAILENLNRVTPEVARIDAVVVTHNHWDHLYGLPGAMSGPARGSSVYVPASAAPAVREQYPAANVVAVSQELQIGPGFWLTGALRAEFRDETLDEQALVIEGPSGLHVFTGCSHPGILQIVRHVRSMFPEAPIALVAGGFHLRSAGDAEIERIAAGLAALGVQRVGPSHCSGDAAKRIFRDRWGERFVSFDLGDTYRF